MPDTTNSRITPHYLVIGQGDIGLAVTNGLAKQDHQVTGLARGAAQDYDRHVGASYIQADARKLSAAQLKDFTHITIIVSPDTYDAEAYKGTYLDIAAHLASLGQELPNLQRVVFISSTGVYGQNNGEWVDETTEPTTPKRLGSVYILQGEKALQQAFDNRAVIIRPSGIYGKNRLMRVRKAKETDKEAMPKYAWSNRIMDSDLVTIIINVMTLKDETTLKPVYLATDFAPVTSYELTFWLSAKLGTTPPPLRSESNTTSSSDVLDMPSASGKRLHSNIPLHWLQYPDWQMGYRAILKDMDKRLK